MAIRNTYNLTAASIPGPLFKSGWEIPNYGSFTLVGSDHGVFPWPEVRQLTCAYNSNDGTWILWLNMVESGPVDFDWGSNLTSIEIENEGEWTGASANYVPPSTNFGLHRWYWIVPENVLPVGNHRVYLNFYSINIDLPKFESVSIPGAGNGNFTLGDTMAGTLFVDWGNSNIRNIEVTRSINNGEYTTDGIVDWDKSNFFFDTTGRQLGDVIRFKFTLTNSDQKSTIAYSYEIELVEEAHGTPEIVDFNKPDIIDIEDGPYSLTPSINWEGNSTNVYNWTANSSLSGSGIYDTANLTDFDKETVIIDSTAFSGGDYINLKLTIKGNSDATEVTGYSGLIYFREQSIDNAPEVISISVTDVVIIGSDPILRANIEWNSVNNNFNEYEWSASKNGRPAETIYFIDHKEAAPTLRVTDGFFPGDTIKIFLKVSNLNGESALYEHPTTLQVESATQELPPSITGIRAPSTVYESSEAELFPNIEWYDTVLKLTQWYYRVNTSQTWQTAEFIDNTVERPVLKTSSFSVGDEIRFRLVAQNDHGLTDYIEDSVTIIKEIPLATVDSISNPVTAFIGSSINPTVSIDWGETTSGSFSWLYSVNDSGWLRDNLYNPETRTPSLFTGAFNIGDRIRFRVTVTTLYGSNTLEGTTYTTLVNPEIPTTFPKPLYAVRLYTDQVNGFAYTEFSSDGRLNIPHTTSVQLDVKEADLSASGFSFTIVNLDTTAEEDSISRWVYSMINDEDKRLYGSKVELLRNGLVVEKGLLKSISNDPFESYYTFEIGDNQSELNSTLFMRELSEYVDVDGTLETIAQVNSRLPNNFNLIEREETTGDPETLRRVLTYTGHPMQLALDLFKILYAIPRIYAGESIADDITYEEFIDVESFSYFMDSENQDYINITYYYEWTEEETSPLEMIREIIYKPCSVYPYFKDGLLAVKKFKQPGVSDPDLNTINENNIINVGTNNVSFETVVNHTKIDSEYVWTKDAYKQQDYYINVDSKNKFGKLLPDSSPVVFDFRGVALTNSENSITTFKSSCSGTLFTRFSETSKTFTVTVPLGNIIFNSGDYINFNHPSLIDWNYGPNQGNRGINPTSGEIDEIANFDVGDTWGSFIPNVLGWYDGVNYVNIGTEISLDMFSSSINGSLVYNCNEVSNWFTSNPI